MMTFSFHLIKVKRPSNFMDFYAYSFRYCLTGIMSLWHMKLDVETSKIFLPFLCFFLIYMVFSTRRETEECGHRECLWTARSCFRIPMSCPGWLFHWVSKGEWPFDYMSSEISFDTLLDIFNIIWLIH